MAITIKKLIAVFRSPDRTKASIETFSFTRTSRLLEIESDGVITQFVNAVQTVVPMKTKME